MTSEHALASNEALFREVNERVRELAAEHDLTWEERVAFVCECATLDCGGSIELTLPEYEEARSAPRTFLLVPGHERHGIERVVRRGDRYLLVEKTGAAGEVAEERDPRSSP